MMNSDGSPLGGSEGGRARGQTGSPTRPLVRFLRDGWQQGKEAIDMTYWKAAVWMVSACAMALVMVGCGNGETAAPAATSGAAAESNAAASSEVRAGGDGGSAAGAAASMDAEGSGEPQPAQQQYVSGSTQAGIWVTGTGEVNLSPDIAILRLGVETIAPTVTESRDQAATAMDAVTASLKRNNLTDQDIQTTAFNIYPEYDYQDMVMNGVRTNTRVLTGYRVRNTVVITIRDLDAVGTIIDDVVNAGGDDTRVDGIDLSIEDRRAFAIQLREAAVQSAMENARHFASLTGVTLGKLVYISEVGSGEPILEDASFDRQVAFAAAAAAPPTTVSGGSLSLSLTVRAGFAIE